MANPRRVGVAPLRFHQLSKRDRERKPNTFQSAEKFINSPKKFMEIVGQDAVMWSKLSLSSDKVVPLTQSTWRKRANPNLILLWKKLNRGQVPRADEVMADRNGTGVASGKLVDSIRHWHVGKGKVRIGSRVSYAGEFFNGNPKVRILKTNRKFNERLDEFALSLGYSPPWIKQIYKKKVFSTKIPGRPFINYTEARFKELLEGYTSTL